MKKRKFSGIYKIENILNGDMYIGQAAILENRERNHFYTLRKNTHRNRHLQRAFNKYGEDSFIFEILLICEKDKETLTYYEQHYVDILHPAYNICRNCVESRLGVKSSKKTRKKLSSARKGKFIGEDHPMFGKHWSEEINLKNSISHMGNKNPNFGIHWSEEVKENMSLGKAGKKKSGEYSSNYVGVSFFVEGTKWRSRITKNGKTFLIGYFKTENEAALAYNTKASELYGDDARLNIIE
jgi:group I intron endonuclease